MAKPNRVVTAEMVEAAIEKRFPQREYALLWQVGNATGFGCRRHADAVAFSLWPSRGLELHGIEIKVSRQDWLKELADPDKAEAIAKYCHRWWLVIGDAKIVQEGELPTNWGLLVLDGEKLKCIKDAPTLQPEAMPLSFIAALFRRTAELAQSREMQAEHKGYERGQKNAAAGASDGSLLKRTQQSLEMLQESIKVFQEKSGLRIEAYNGEDLGVAVGMLMRQRFRPEPLDELESAAGILEAKAALLREDAKVMKKALASLPATAPESELALIRGGKT